MKFVDVYSNLREAFPEDAQNGLVNQLPGLTINNVLDWVKLRQIAVACDEGHVYNLPRRFPDVLPSTLERAAELLCPNDFYY